MANPNLNELRLVISEEGLLNKAVPLKTRYERATQIRKVREILDLELPQVTDLSEILGITGQGKVLAVRMDLNSEVDNHKKFVVAGLILRAVLRGQIPNERTDTFIDGGSFNSAKALKFYVRRFGMRGMYVMSYLFPKHITDLLESDDFTVIRAPHKYERAREREFYEFLFERMQDAEFRKNKFCLWHAKYGGIVEYPFGVEIARSLASPVDCVVSCLGAGSTLEGIQIPVQDFFREERSLSSAIFVVEHELSPLFVKSIGVHVISREVVPAGMADGNKYLSVPELPHVVIGPHYDEINPLLARKSIARIDGIIQYNETDWQATQAYLAVHEISVGNSSAANVSVAWRLASQGRQVLTVIFEPFRKFLLKNTT